MHFDVYFLKLRPLAANVEAESFALGVMETQLNTIRPT